MWDVDANSCYVCSPRVDLSVGHRDPAKVCMQYTWWSRDVLDFDPRRVKSCNKILTSTVVHTVAMVKRQHARRKGNLSASQDFSTTAPRFFDSMSPSHTGLSRVELKIEALNPLGRNFQQLRAGLHYPDHPSDTARKMYKASEQTFRLYQSMWGCTLRYAVSWTVRRPVSSDRAVHMQVWV